MSRTQHHCLFAFGLLGWVVEPRPGRVRKLRIHSHPTCSPLLFRLSPLASCWEGQVSFLSGQTGVQGQTWRWRAGLEEIETTERALQVTGKQLLAACAYLTWALAVPPGGHAAQAPPPLTLFNLRLNSINLITTPKKGPAAKNWCGQAWETNIFFCLALSILNW